MARMKFLCDADRCIECNACVTACKNEHEVPWGINRRRVVTINDGKPGERSVSMACMHCTDAPCAAVCPVNCFYTTADGVVLHSKDLCIGCGYCFYACPFGAPQYPKIGNFGSRGKMDKCTYCAGGPEADGSKEEYEKYGANRLAEGKLPLCAEMCSTKSLLAGDGEIIAQIYKERVTEARLRLRAPGAGRPPIARRSSPEGGAAATRRNIEEEAHGVFWKIHPLSSRRRGRSLLIIATSVPSTAQQVNPTASSVKEQQLLQELNRIQGRVSIPDQRSGVLEQPAGRDWREFRNVTLRWIGGIAILGMLAVLVIFYLTPRHGSARERTVRAHHRALHGVRALRALDDRDLLHRSGDLRIEHHLRPSVATAADRLRSVLRMVAVGEIRPQLSELSVHHWRCADLPDVDRRQHSEQGRMSIGSSEVAVSSVTITRRPIASMPARRRSIGSSSSAAALVAVTGYELMFPFYLSGIEGMQLAQIVHSIVAVLFVAAMLAHIYIGTIGMEGAFEAMGSGTVDVNWAREHHSLWLEEQNARSGANDARPRSAVTAAE